MKISDLGLIGIWIGMAITGILTISSSVVFGAISIFTNFNQYWANLSIDFGKIAIALFVPTFILGVVTDALFKKQENKKIKTSEKVAIILIALITIAVILLSFSFVNEMIK